MAKTTLNTALGGLSGRVDQWVYRRHKHQVVVAKRPTPPAVASSGQVANRERFRQARAYAKTILADPCRRRVYEALARTREQRVDRLLIADYLSAPTIDFIEVSEYSGQPGDLIQVGATDDLEVVAVTISIRGAAGQLLEQGLAAKEHGVWRYAATLAIARGESVTVAATARDRAGNETTADCLKRID